MMLRHAVPLAVFMSVLTGCGDDAVPEEGVADANMTTTSISAGEDPAAENLAEEVPASEEQPEGQVPSSGDISLTGFELVEVGADQAPDLPPGTVRATVAGSVYEHAVTCEVERDDSAVGFLTRTVEDSASAKGATVGIFFYAETPGEATMHISAHIWDEAAHVGDDTQVSSSVRASNVFGDEIGAVLGVINTEDQFVTAEVVFVDTTDRVRWLAETGFDLELADDLPSLGAEVAGTFELRC